MVSNLIAFFSALHSGQKRSSRSVTSFSVSKNVPKFYFRYASYRFTLHLSPIHFHFELRGQTGAGREYLKGGTNSL